jgi:hypothetical protein
LALKFFGERNPVGRTLSLKVLDQFEPYTVSGVLADPPSNSSIRLGILLPIARYAVSDRGKQDADRWSRCSMETYVELIPGAHLSSDTQRLFQFYNPRDWTGRQPGARNWSCQSAGCKPIAIGLAIFGRSPVNEWLVDDFGLDPCPGRFALIQSIDR